MKTKLSNSNSRNGSGFSLVATVTIMILLSLIAVGLLSLSVTTLRATRSDAAFQEARGNARLGLQLALAQLQKTAGKDQAVTAPAEVFVKEVVQPHLVGAWDSWNWDPTVNSSAPNYKEEKESRFNGWLTSQTGLDEENQGVAYASTKATVPVAELFAEGTFGTASGQEPIVAELIPLSVDDENPKGNLAWTVLLEDTKARVDLVRDKQRPKDGEHLAASLTFPEKFHQDALEIEGFTPENEEEWSQVVTTKSLDAAAGSGNNTSPAKKNFFDYTVYSRGVLSDVANGGLKRDLTTIFEDQELMNEMDGMRVYSGESEPFGVADPHWSYLADYYNQYLNFQGESATEPVDVTESIVDLRGQRGYDRDDTSPEALTLRPVVAKLQIVFSMVTHPLEMTKVGNWVNAYNSADARYANQHLRAWLVFEPVITLWNPYSVPIQFDALSIGLDKIPVAFRFGKKSGRGDEVDMRVVESQGGRNSRSYWPLSNFVWFGSKDDAITNFSFNIRGGDMDNGLNTREPVVLEPGENKVFSMYVRRGTNFGRVSSNFMIQGSGDVGAGSSNSLVKGVDMVEGYNDVGGFRFDHLGRNNSNRNPASLYSFETRSINSGWFQVMVLRPQDSVVVKAKLSNNDANTDREEESMDHFTMLVEMDKVDQVESDKTEGSSFTVREMERLLENPDEEIIQRTYNAAAIQQTAADTDRGGKEPFAVLTMTAKSTNELLSPTKGWLYGNPVLAAYEQDENEAPQPLQSYEFSFREVASVDSFPMVELDPANNRGYFGSGQTAETGLTATPMFTLPTNPMVSIGQFQAANLISAVRPPFFNYPLGNSFAHPLLESDQVVNGTFVDHSYLLNQRLWDSYYFSGLSKRGNASSAEALTNFFSGESTLTPRLQPYLGQGQSTEEVIASLSSEPSLAASELAGYQMLEGAFNIHSTSVNAWKALLMSNFQSEVPTRDNESHEVVDATPFTRSLPGYSKALNDLGSAAGSGDVGEDALRRAERWLGHHELTEEQCELLAESIVEQIQLRCSEDEGPFLSFSEFVNRRVGGSNDSFTDKGVLQTAIDLANAPSGGSSQVGIGVEGKLFSLEDGVGIENMDDRVLNPKPLEGNTAEGSPATLIQGDILQQIGSVVSVRSDTFRVRSYGNSVSKSGEVQAEAWCEAIVQRVPDFVDSSQSPGTEVEELNVVNENFGRRFQVVSFRWLASEEV